MCWIVLWFAGKCLLRFKLSTLYCLCVCAFWLLKITMLLLNYLGGQRFIDAAAHNEMHTNLVENDFYKHVTDTHQKCRRFQIVSMCIFLSFTFFSQCSWACAVPMVAPVANVRRPHFNTLYLYRALYCVSVLVTFFLFVITNSHTKIIRKIVCDKIHKMSVMLSFGRFLNTFFFWKFCENICFSRMSRHTMNAAVAFQLFFFSLYRTIITQTNEL